MGHPMVASPVPLGRLPSLRAAFGPERFTEGLRKLLWAAPIRHQLKDPIPAASASHLDLAPEPRVGPRGKRGVRFQPPTSKMSSPLFSCFFLFVRFSPSFFIFFLGGGSLGFFHSPGKKDKTIFWGPIFPAEFQEQMILTWDAMNGW